MPTRMTTPARQDGFFLLEVLVAFAILALSLGVLLQGVQLGLRNAALVEDYTQARLYAQSLLAALGRESPLTAGVAEGRIDEKFSWRTTVVPYREDALVPSKAVSPFRLVVEVFWIGPRKPRSVSLETLRLAPAG